MDSPLVSIVIPCFDAARFLDQAIDSCLRQGYARREIVAVDDGSTDGTREVIARHAAEHGVIPVLRSHAGVSAARNAGMDAASGSYLLFLDADDLLEHDALERLVARAVAGGGCAAAGNWRNFWEGSSRSEVVCAKPHYPHDAHASCVRRQMFHGAVLLPRTGQRWNENRSVWEALEYQLRHFAAGGELGYVDAVVVHVRQHDSPERFSTRHDHFEPAMTGAFFSEQKAELVRGGALSFARSEALDQKIVDNACALVRQGRRTEAERLLDAVNLRDLVRYDWYRQVSFAGAVHRLGPRVGSSVFYYANRALGRL